MPAHSDLVHRVGDTLTVVTAGGTQKFVDGTQFHLGEAAWYSFLGVSANRYAILHGQWTEGDFALAVDRRSGEVAHLWAVPLPSPDRQRFLVTSLDLFAGYVPQGIQVWRSTDSGLELEWQLEIDEWGPDRARWVDSRTVEFNKVEHCDPPGETCSTPARLEYRGGAWSVSTT